MKFTMILASVALMLPLAACNKKDDVAATKGADPVATAAAIAPPAGSDWTEVTSKTTDGGMLMGNPNAAVKLIEYGALSCSHCAKFSADSSTALKAYVAKGTVSYEFRNFMLNILDVPAALLARCGGAGPFFPIAEQLYTNQRDWMGKTSTITAAEQAGWANLPPNQVATVLAGKLGLDSFVQARGIGAEKAKACLADKAAVDELGNMSKVAQEKFEVKGTPTFVLNGKTIQNVAEWKDLEPILKNAGA